MPDVGSLYPQPPSQNNNPLGGINPLQLIDTLQAMQLRNIAIQRESGQLPAATAQPGATLQGTNIDNARRSGELANLYTMQAQAHMSDLANRADEPTPADVHNWTAYGAQLFPDVPARIWNSTADMMTKDRQGVRHAASMLQLSAAGPAAAIARAPGPPVGTAPAQAATGRLTTAGAVGGGGVGGVPTGQPVGQEIPQGVAAAAAGRLEDTARTSPQYHADLANLKQDSRTLGNVQGMTAEAEKRINTTLQRFGIPGITMSREQLAAADSFDKIINQISTNQAASVGAATDAGRHMIAGAVPNLEQSKYGREGVIDMLQGNQDFVDRARQAWLDASNVKKWGANAVPANAHNAWMAQWAADADPRVFQVNRMSAAGQKQFLADIDPDEREEFTRKWNFARARGWVGARKTEQANAK